MTPIRCGSVARDGAARDERAREEDTRRSATGGGRREGVGGGGGARRARRRGGGGDRGGGARRARRPSRPSSPAAAAAACCALSSECCSPSLLLPPPLTVHDGPSSAARVESPHRLETCALVKGPNRPCSIRDRPHILKPPTWHSACGGGSGASSWSASTAPVRARARASRFPRVAPPRGSPEYLRSRGPCRAPTSRSDDCPLQAQARRGRHDRPDDRCAPRARDIAALRSDPAETLVRFSPIEVARRAGQLARVATTRVLGFLRKLVDAGAAGQAARRRRGASRGARDVGPRARGGGGDR